MDSSRTAMFQAVNSGRSGAVVGGRVFAAGAADTDTERPFIVIRRGLREPSVKSTSVTKVENWVFYVHNDPQDALTIDDVIEALHYDLGGLAPKQYEGLTISSCEWLDDSEDLADDHYDTNSRNTSWRVVTTPR